MILFPAIDLRDGCCVRLRQGDYARQTTYSADPVSVATGFADAGATHLHVVDLDGARAGAPVNGEAVRDLAALAAARGMTLQVGGGLRDEAAVDRVLGWGAARAVLGTRVVADPAWLERLTASRPHRVVVSLDARDGLVAVHGWTGGTALTVKTAFDRVRDLPLAGLVYTDIARDGMLAGPDVETTARLAAEAPFPVIASGGVATAEDVLTLKRRGVPACILGRSLYEGKIDLAALVRRLEEGTHPPVGPHATGG